ncbi:hypothetical protein [Limnospira platensis]|nr:hypothetical protein [Arthrospira platensis NCB002]WAK73884.1 hypothetical protein AP9108_35865 [Arthrospira sp. PCC 9108]
MKPNRDDSRLGETQQGLEMVGLEMVVLGFVPPPNLLKWSVGV